MSRFAGVVNKDIQNLTILKKNKKHYNNTLAIIKNKLETLEISIEKRLKGKFIRDNIKCENQNAINHIKIQSIYL